MGLLPSHSVSSSGSPPAPSSPRRPSAPYTPSVKLLALCFVPVILWLLLFTCGVALIPDEKRPTINVTLLPFLDKHVFLSSHTWFPSSNTSTISSVLDLVAAVPYTVHPLLPFAFLTVSLPSRVRRAKLPVFILAFGTMNLAAVCTHLTFPTAPPWYYIKHGVQPANYSMKGDPAILARLDQRYNMQLYHNMYAKGGKVVFGAWPSLHAAWPYLIARFPSHFPSLLARVLWLYALLVWWAAIYLRHHYLADIVGAILFAEIALRVAMFVIRSWGDDHLQEDLCTCKSQQRQCFILPYFRRL
ncbi:Inositol phosphorylceramide synthase catalytic subunit aur1 [Gracilariopsis chorda]|uniref:Inositol phosphorylceramide synthase catalytic subunit aur1 n=1 Tax=Gracilariopsis chorda TaxID=448386 RepID=A0A2V3IYK3_9FLOR|nr:Inositol phosphorylceramide synthase catalytic subunit aur1 [Gracilariopsis chorda]|eukprot:PXF47232.1 Inositol phosphorylceramide synthase catalytic subunit aur1 [Gracilariopsis chorda]